MRGFCGIGIYGGTTQANLGTLWRTAHCIGADFVFTVGARYKHQRTDTMKAIRHMPLWHFEDLQDLRVPEGCDLIGVELDENSHPLETFKHPQRAVYLLGAEDEGLPDEALQLCSEIVEIPTVGSLNVAVAGSIVLYDRVAKADR